jgi:SagB-type dehydrogenase family enzyme
MTENIGQEFMRQTRLDVEQRPTSPQTEGVPQPPLELGAPPQVQRIPLPHPDDFQIPPFDLRTAIEQRSSLRHYAPDPLTLEELAYQLWLTQGVKRVTDRPATLRNVPSAGARHAFETYLLINRVEGLQPGLYRYLALEHTLIALDLSAEILNRVTTGCLEQKQVRTSAVTFLWVADMARMYWRYTQRGYRYLHLDAGHVCQNLYLAAEATHCGVCAIAAFDDENLNRVLGLDGENLFVTYIASLGKRGLRAG